MTRFASCRRNYNRHGRRDCFDREEAVSNAVEYVIVTGVMLILLVFTVILANYIFIEGPSDTLKHNSYLDTGERLSARIVDMHMLAPESGRIVTGVDVPREIAGKGYDIRVSPAIDDSGTGQYLAVGDGQPAYALYVRGIETAPALKGNFTGDGEYTLEYDSEGVW